MSKPTLNRDVINADLAPRGIVMISEYKGTNEKGTFTYPCGHVNTVTVSSVRKGNGCAKCAAERRARGLGFNANAQRGVGHLRSATRSKQQVTR